MHTREAISAPRPPCLYAGRVPRVSCKLLRGFPRFDTGTRPPLILRGNLTITRFTYHTRDLHWRMTFVTRTNFNYRYLFACTSRRTKSKQAELPLTVLSLSSRLFFRRASFVSLVRVHCFLSSWAHKLTELRKGLEEGAGIITDTALNHF